MTFLQLARRNAWRKPMRTGLLIFSIAIAFLIYGLTACFLTGTQGSGTASESLLAVTNKAGRGQTLPIAYLDKIATEKGVAAVAYMTRLRGFNAVENNIIVANAVDPALFAKTNGADLGLTPDLLTAFGQARDGVLVGRTLAQAQGWTVGQRIEVTAFQLLKADGSRNWSFEIAGIFDGAESSTDTYFMIAQYEYINAARARDKDTVDGFAIRPAAGVSSSALAAQIDALFANSGAPTRTQSEKQFLEAFIRQYADVQLIITLVVTAAFVTILMIVINTMLFAIRERTFEIGVLKTLGFTNGHIVSLVLSETMLIFLLGGALGLALTKLATVLAGAAIGLTFTADVLGKSLAMMVVLGLFTGLLPAASAMRTTISNAFKTR